MPVWSTNLPDGQEEHTFVRRLLLSNVSDVSRRTIADMIPVVNRTGERVQEICEMQGPQGGVIYKIDMSSAEGGTVRLVLVDITEEGQNQDSVRKLSLELAHRTKNLLAVVLSLATQTSRRSRNYTQFHTRFLDQVEALSIAHDLIASTGWTGARLVDIAESALLAKEFPARIMVDPAISGRILKPNGVQNFAIILRELQAVSRTDTRVRCHVAPMNDGALEFSWECATSCDAEIWEDMLVKYAPVALDGTGCVTRENGDLRYRLTIGKTQVAD